MRPRRAVLTLLRCDTTLARLDSDMMDGIGLSGPGQESDRELIWEGGLAMRLRISKLSDSKQPDNQYPLSSAINSVPCLNNSNNTVVQLPQIHRRNSRYEISRANNDPALYTTGKSGFICKRRGGVRRLEDDAERPVGLARIPYITLGLCSPPSVLHTLPFLSVYNSLDILTIIMPPLPGEERMLTV